MNSLKWLTLLLRLHAAVLILAVVPIFFPYSWMNLIHQWLGLGELPQAPIVEYLTRSLSLVYALHGIICLILTLDIQRYLPLIRMISVVHCGFGAIILGIDLHAQMPSYWTWTEGPPIIGFAIWIYCWSSSLLQQPTGESSSSQSFSES